MKVLSVASEIYPLIKTGGLADVAGALPLALAGRGVEVKTLIPAYPAVRAALREEQSVLRFGDLLGVEAQILSAKVAGLDLLVLDAPALFDRSGGPYIDRDGRDHHDNWRRFAALSLAGAHLAAGRLPDWRPDLVHVHDWQTGLVPAYMRFLEPPALPSVMTIHNIAFQGNFPSSIFPMLGLPAHAFDIDGVEYYGQVGYLKAGIQTAWAVSTVSPSYAEEILTPEFGMGLEGLLNRRSGELHGIVNGIDTDVWNPQTDPAIARPYGAGDLKPRADNKRTVETHFGLVDDDSPLFCVISRLTWQKGMDLVAEVVDDLVERGGKLAVLGSGDPGLVAALQSAAARHPGRVGIAVSYNEPLSHLMQAGCDAILIPSRFEPCGLTQLYGLRYGCVPVVSRTGGLNDTVIDANPAALGSRAATGISFSPVTSEALRRAIRRTIRLYEDKKTWAQIQKQGMKSDVSWDKSAALYEHLYSSLLPKGSH
ncbi:glycogen synthase GlgA [Rhizobium sp. SSA_523]|uniref:glycogen synthase GlgA n=1 Tax=Rhizobium sp. SSA_523 TaxID=2952477 RepID=UPI002091D7D3|nr:glycogen synthase GlgA [Rhizobium sp. SSA_523]MCO5731860.1 glycogen synthase GlgA [Rhizobium sp. SSA_523]WKC22780.1 glycogen synthase GlgA [Rhizobium sp. SSA_523]